MHEFPRDKLGKGPKEEAHETHSEGKLEGWFILVNPGALRESSVPEMCLLTRPVRTDLTCR